MEEHREIKLAKIMGVEITIDYSWFWIFLLITISFSASILPLLAPGNSSFNYFVFGIIGSLLFFISVLIHEFCHTIVARLNHLPINKITLFIFGGASRLDEEPPSPKIEIKMAVAGPISSVILGSLLYAISDLINQTFGTSIFSVLLYILGFVNFSLALFNLLPGFPLDGGRILRGILWSRSQNLERSTRIASYSGQIVALMIVVFGIIRLLTFSFLGGIWLIAIGYFLWRSAVISYQMTIATIKLRKIMVRDIMKKPMPVDANMSVAELRNLAFENRQEIFVIMLQGQPIGLLSASELESEDIDEQENLSKYYRNIDSFPKIYADEHADKILSRLSNAESAILPVFDSQDHLIGVVTILDVVYWLSLQPRKNN